MLKFKAGNKLAGRDSGGGPLSRILDVGARNSTGQTFDDRQTVGPHSSASYRSEVSLEIVPYYLTDND